jgi:hypothetical protein
LLCVVLAFFSLLLFEEHFCMRHKKLSLTGVVSVLALTFSVTASAHLPFVVPFQFHTDQEVVTLYAGSADKYFEPEIPGGGAEGGYDFTVTNPAGETDHVEQISRHRQLTLIEIDTPKAGTYKVERTLVSRAFPQVAHQGRAVEVSDATGEERKAQEARRIKDGVRQFFFADEVKPADIVGVRFVNHVTTYVTRDTPNDAALKTSGKGFEFDFRVHPNRVSVKSGLQFVALVDGKAAPGVTFEVFRQGEDKTFKLKSDAAGLVEVRFEQPGVYVLRAGDAPLESLRGGKVVNPRYINWLIFEVRP